MKHRVELGGSGSANWQGVYFKIKCRIIELDDVRPHLACQYSEVRRNLHRHW